MGVIGAVEDAMSQGCEHGGRETGKRRMSQKMNIKYGKIKAGQVAGNTLLRAKEREITAGKGKREKLSRIAEWRWSLVRGRRQRRLRSA